MFNIYMLIQSADRDDWATIDVGQLQIGLVGMGLEFTKGYGTEWPGGLTNLLFSREMVHIS